MRSKDKPKFRKSRSAGSLSCRSLLSVHLARTLGRLGHWESFSRNGLLDCTSVAAAGTGLLAWNASTVVLALLVSFLVPVESLRCDTAPQGYVEPLNGVSAPSAR